LPSYGLRSRFAFVIGRAGPDRPEGELEVDIYAAGRWLTCDDCTPHLASFTDCLMRTVAFLLTDGVEGQFRRPFPELSPADNHRRLRADAKAGDNIEYLAYRFMDWGPTTDNVSAHLFISDGIASIPFSFWRPGHHDPSELGQVFVAELPLRELMRVLHQTGWYLAQCGIVNALTLSSQTQESGGKEP